MYSLNILNKAVIYLAAFSFPQNLPLTDILVYVYVCLSRYRLSTVSPLVYTLDFVI